MRRFRNILSLRRVISGRSCNRYCYNFPKSPGVIRARGDFGERPPSGGLELHAELPLDQSEEPWFPALPGPLTLEAWIYIDASPPFQKAFSLVGQTNRFNWAVLGGAGDSNFDGIKDARGGILTKGIAGDAGIVTGQLVARRWVHYVAIIDGGAVIGSQGLVRKTGAGSPLASANAPLILGGVPILPGNAFPHEQETLPASGVYIDELRISRVVRYKGKYPVPTKAFTADADTLGLYHFDEESSERYEDASEYHIALVRRSGKKVEPESNQ